MNRPSPPKPWERPGSSNPVRPSSTISPSPSPLASSSLTPSTSTSLTTTTQPRPPLRPWERRDGRNDYDSYSRSSYGGYGGSYGSSYGSGSGYGSSYGSSYGGYGSGYGSSYGNSSYGSSYGGGYGSSYGGYGRDRDYGGGYGTYGRSSYGDYGGGGYGGGYGGYGGGYGGYGRDPYDKGMRGFSFLNNLQYFVDSFSRFSRLLDANYDAMHGSFSSVVRLLEHMGRLNFEVMTVIKTFALFRIVQSVISRTFGVFSFLLPWRYSASSSSSTNPLSVSDFQQFAKLPSTTSPPNNTSPTTLTPHTPPSWRTLLVVFLLAFVGLPMAVNKMFSVLSRRNPMELEWNKEGGGAGGGRGEEVVAVHEFRGESSRELSFSKGDVLVVVNKFHPDWWEAELNGQVGVIPANYVSSSPSTSLDSDDKSTN